MNREVAPDFLEQDFTAMTPTAWLLGPSRSRSSSTRSRPPCRRPDSSGCSASGRHEPCLVLQPAQRGAAAASRLAQPQLSGQPLRPSQPPQGHRGGRSLAVNADPRHDNSRRIQAATRHGSERQELAHRGAAAHADEQSRPRGRRAAGGARGLWRHRPGRAQLGALRHDRRRRCARSRTTRRCWSSRASRSACSGPTPTRRAC